MGLLAATLLACSSGDDAGRPTAPRNAAPPIAQAAAPIAQAARVILSGDAGDVEVQVEVVDTDATIQRGLMYRRYLAPDAGMLFVPRHEKVWTFWMRNTLIPLDMIFIARDLTVAGVVADTVPLDETPRSVDRPSLYILEVNAGWAARHGVRAGSRVRFVGVEAVAPR